jgi:hypothetical protein
VFNALRIEGSTSRSISISKETLRGYEGIYEGFDDEELEVFDTYAADLDSFTDTTDDAKEQCGIEACEKTYFNRYPASSSPRFSKSRQAPTSVKAPPPFPGAHLPPPPAPPGASEPITIVRPNHLAYTKLIIHALKYPHDTVNGLLLGQRSAPDAAIDIVDVVPLLHNRIDPTSSIIEVGLGLVRPPSPRPLISVTLLSN